MQGYAAVFAVAAMCSAAFIDSNVKKSVRVFGWSALAISSVLFVVTETIALFN